MKKMYLFWLFSIIILFVPALADALEISHLVIFGDSLSDRGYTQYGGFNRYSNGLVWPEYIEKVLCRDCVQDYAWGGAKTGYGNYNGFNWSGVLWQIDQYKQNTDSNKTLYVIFAGGNDLIDGDVDGAKPAKNIDLAITKLISKGAKYIAIFTLPDFTRVPGYNNPKMPDYKKMSAVKSAVKKHIIAYNKELKAIAAQHSDARLYLIDTWDFFNELINKHVYRNTIDPWFKTYHYPAPNDYMWWDAWHPMTNVHQRFSEYIKIEMSKRNIIFITN